MPPLRGIDDSAAEETSEAEQAPPPPVKRRSRRSRRRRVVDECLFNATLCKYDCVRDGALKRGWRTVDAGKGPTGDEEERCNVYWIDVANIYERMKAVKPWQRINHFPGMTNIARKSRMAQNLERMRRLFPSEFQFYPKTWVLPSDFADFRAHFDSYGRSKDVFIVKPDSGCQGRGIFLTSDISQVDGMESQVAQHYIRRPLLIDGFKFDLRLYVLVSSVKPLRMYLFREGLVRLATQEYVKPNSSNISDRCMHLTNYAINKGSDNFEHAAGAGASSFGEGSKRSLSWFLEWIASEKGHKKAKVMWQRISSLCAKTVIAVVPTLVREYEDHFEKALRQRPTTRDATPGHSPPLDTTALREATERERCPRPCGEDADGGCLLTGDPVRGSRCFEVLGFDVIVEQNLRPWLVEVNHLPSFGTDSPVDAEVKGKLMEQVFRIIQAEATDQRKYKEWQSRLSEHRLMRLAKPPTSPAGQSATVGRARRQLQLLYAKYAPEKMLKVESLLRKYEGKEERLVEALERKYRGAPDADSGPEQGVTGASDAVDADNRHDDESSAVPVSVTRTGSGTASDLGQQGASPAEAGVASATPAGEQLSASGESRASPDAASRPGSARSAQTPTRPAGKNVYDCVFADSLDALAWEASRLPDFDRLFPPPAQPPPVPPYPPIGAYWEDDLVIGYDALIAGESLPFEERRPTGEPESEPLPALAVPPDSGSDTDGERAARERAAKRAPKRRTNYRAIIVKAMEAEDVRHRRFHQHLKPAAPPAGREDAAAPSHGPDPLTAPRGGLGWRPPPTRVGKEPPKRPSVEQAAAAERLSKGYSTIPIGTPPAAAHGPVGAAQDGSAVNAAEHPWYNLDPAAAQDSAALHALLQQLGLDALPPEAGGGQQGGSSNLARRVRAAAEYGREWRRRAAAGGGPGSRRGKSAVKAQLISFPGDRQFPDEEAALLGSGGDRERRADTDRGVPRQIHLEGPARQAPADDMALITVKMGMTPSPPTAAGTGEPQNLAQQPPYRRSRPGPGRRKRGDGRPRGLSWEDAEAASLGSAAASLGSAAASLARAPLFAAAKPLRSKRRSADQTQGSTARGAAVVPLATMKAMAHARSDANAAGKAAVPGERLRAALTRKDMGDYLGISAVASAARPGDLRRAGAPMRSAASDAYAGPPRRARSGVDGALHEGMVNRAHVTRVTSKW